MGFKVVKVIHLDDRLMQIDIDDLGVYTATSVPTGISPTISELNNIQDVDVGGAVNGQYLQYDGSDWKAVDAPVITKLSSVGDVVGDAANNQYLSWDGAEWIPTTLVHPSSTVTNFSSIGDIVGGLSEGDILVLSGANLVAGQRTSATVTNISSIGDVSGGASEGDILRQNSASEWVPDQITSVIPSLYVDKEPTGFPNRTDSVMSFDTANRRFAIAPVASQYEYYQSGEQFIKSASDTLVISVTEGEHCIFFESGSLYETGSISSEIIRCSVLVSDLYWDNDNSKCIYFAEERHGLRMDGITHDYLHFTQGTQYLEGLAIGDITADADGSSATDAQFSIGSGYLADEDILISITALSIPANIPVYYLESASKWRMKEADDYPFMYSDGVYFTGANSRIPYNNLNAGLYELTEIGNGKFVLVHIFATNNKYSNMIAITGQAEYGTIIEAREGATTEINNLVTAGLPFAEFTPIGTVILQTSTAYTNVPKTRIRTTDEGDNYVDFRKFKLASTGSPSDHGVLSGLLDDDHPQYLNIDGRTTIQVISGDVEISGTLVINTIELNLSGLSDVSGDASEADILVYRCGSWKPEPNAAGGSATVTDLSSIGNVIGGASEADILVLNSANQWIAGQQASSREYITHENGILGNPLYGYDNVVGTHVALGPLVVVDSSGNLVY